MRTVLCDSCGRSIADDLPLVPVKFTEQRKSTRHAWRRLHAPARFCRDCATDEPGEGPADALVRPSSREFLSGAETVEHCEACGTAVLLVKVARRKHVYCSTACRAQIYRDAAEVDQVERPCGRCGDPVTGRSDRKYCSARCRTAAHRDGSANTSPASGGRDQLLMIADGALQTAQGYGRTPALLSLPADARGKIAEALEESAATLRAGKSS